MAQLDTTSIVASSLALVGALAWRDAWTTFIDSYFPLPGSNLNAKFIYALLITLFIFLIFNLYLYLTKKYEEYQIPGTVQKIVEYMIPNKNIS